VDVVKALALGARAVMIGRATLYGPCAAGEAGAARALEILKGELERAMKLCGAHKASAIGSDFLFKPAWDYEIVIIRSAAGQRD
jgi:(S)-mandelate dehydrogenase